MTRATSLCVLLLVAMVTLTSVQQTEGIRLLTDCFKSQTKCVKGTTFAKSCQTSCKAKGYDKGECGKDSGNKCLMGGLLGGWMCHCKYLFK